MHGDYPKGHLVLFDGYESHGASKIAFHLVKPYIKVHAAFTSADQVSSAQPVQITSTLQRNKGQPPADGTTQQVEEEHDGHGNEGNGGGGWGSGSTPHAFRQSSGDSYCVTHAIHDTKVRDLQRKVDEESTRNASLDTQCRKIGAHRTAETTTRASTVSTRPYHGHQPGGVEMSKLNNATQHKATQRRSNAATQQRSNATTQSSKAATQRSTTQQRSIAAAQH
jgi:hypothetical protein